MRTSRRVFLVSVHVLAALFVFLPQPASLGAAGASYTAAWQTWRASDGGFAGGWTHNGVDLSASGEIILATDASWGYDPYPAGGYYDHNFYNGGAFRVGEATSPEVTATFARRSPRGTPTRRPVRGWKR
jgi:hypothetical protein